MANNSVSNPTFKPRRGSYSSMHNSNIVLEEGELFVETPDLGPGRGAMKMKMGDGVSDYDNLPYGLGDDTTTLTVDIVEDSSTTTTEALAKLTTGKTVGEYTGLFKKIDELEKSDLDTYKNSLDRSDKTSNVTADSSATAEAAEANVVNGKKLSEHIGSLKQAATKNTGSIRTLEKLISNDANGVYITGDSTVTTNRDLKAKATTNINIGNNNNTGADAKPDIAIGLSNTIYDSDSDSAGYNIFLGYNNKPYSSSEHGSYNTVIGYNNQINNEDYSKYYSGSTFYYKNKNVVIGNNNQTSSDESGQDIIIGNDNDAHYLDDIGNYGSLLIGNSLKNTPVSYGSSSSPILIGNSMDIYSKSATRYTVAVGYYIGNTYSYYTYGTDDFIALGSNIRTSTDGANGIYIGSGINISNEYYDQYYQKRYTTANTIIGANIEVGPRSTGNIIINSPESDYCRIGQTTSSGSYIDESIILTTHSLDYKSYMYSDMVYLGTGGSQPSTKMDGSTTSCRFMFACGSQSYLELDYGGKLRAYGGVDTTAPSDKRLKDIQNEPIPDVSSVKAIQFKWNEESKNEDKSIHTGYIAQDVEAVAPQYVSTNGEGLKSLNYMEFLIAKVDNLEKRLEQMDQLENKIDSLEKKVAELEAKLAEKDN